MKVHKVTLTIIDMDELGAEEVRSVIENAHYPNRCISPEVERIETADIGEWSDDHPLNQNGTASTELRRMFPDGTDGIRAQLAAAEEKLDNVLHVSTEYSRMTAECTVRAVTAETRLAAAVELLRKCEWTPNNIGELRCIECGGYRYESGHAPDCACAAFLAPAKDA